MKRYLPPLTSLRAFEAAARHGSFKRAAEELCVTPSSVSHQIQKLEDWLGVQLFQRLNRKVVLTDAGRTYFGTIASAFDEMAAVTGLIRKPMRGETEHQKLKVFANAGFVECWLGPRLSALQAAVPGVQLEVAFGSSVEDYLRGNADVAIHFGRGDWPEYQSAYLRTGYEFPVCSPDLPPAGQQMADPSSLAGFQLLHEDDASGWAKWLAYAGVQHPGIHKGPIFHSTQTIFSKVIACEGIALGDDIVAADLLLAGGLIKPVGLVRKSNSSLYFLQFRTEATLPGIASVRDWLTRELQSHEEETALLRLNEPYPTKEEQGASSVCCP